MSSGLRPILSRAPLIAIAPNLGAEIEERTPKKLPIGVLAADTITTSLLIVVYLAVFHAKITKI
jgi:hypothetical protein